jgi:eukaryotic-like serine/threonine-protein kinase
MNCLKNATLTPTPGARRPQDLAVSFQSAMPSPAESLTGLKLLGGWTVIKKIVNSAPDASGGNFSCSYEIAHDDGRRAFLKALDYTRALREKDVPRALQSLVNAFVFERDLLVRCNERKMSRIVQSIHADSIVVNATEIGKVDYLIFERADSDIRGHLSAAGTVELAWKLRSLHHMATGLLQLHSDNIAHQDVKPSNVLVFDGMESKIGDVGSASIRGIPSPRDDRNYAGDPAYAPIEQLYGYLDPEWSKRRQGCDAYLLGSMIVFMFTGLSATSLIFKKMQPQHRPGVWTGNYVDVLPYVREAFGLALTEFSEHVPHDQTRAELKRLVEYLCDPDITLRGHPLNRRGQTQQFSMERFVSNLNLLAERAELLIRRQ